MIENFHFVVAIETRIQVQPPYKQVDRLFIFRSLLAKTKLRISTFHACLLIFLMIDKLVHISQHNNIYIWDAYVVSHKNNFIVLS